MRGIKKKSQKTEIFKNMEFKNQIVNLKEM